MQIAVVTGAGRGLGRSIARGLAQKGYRVLATDILGESAEETANLIGNGAWGLVQDVSDPESHRQVAAAAREQGELALWVNNAGILRSAPAWEHSDDDVRQQIEINTLGLMYGARAAIGVMRGQSHGHIINIASISSISPAPGVAVYAASKHAALGFSISLQGDLKHANLPIHVSAICPDAIDTDMTRVVKDDKDAALLFSSSRLLTVDDVTREVMDLVDKPKIMVVVPRVRGALVQMFRPFPMTGLRVLEGFRKLGERNQRKR